MSPAQLAFDSPVAIARWRYLLVFAIVQVVLVSVLLAAVTFSGPYLPAPRLSANESFNEKARWLREHGTSGCDVLVIGSSMALNDVDSARIAKIAGAKSVLNAGSWSLSVQDAAELTKILAPLCKPRAIVMAAYYGDFGGLWTTPIDWELTKSYINGGNRALTYLRSMDPIYYGVTYLSRRERATKGNAIYESLRFDSSGSVMLDCNSFQIDPGRWKGHTGYQPLNDQLIKLNLGGLAAIEAVAKASDSRLLFVMVPLRPVAEASLANREISGLWDTVARSVRGSGGDFMRLRSSHDFQDTEFVDFAHLNACGASMAADFIGSEVRKLLSSE